jgi:hypothetical protein
MRMTTALLAMLASTLGVAAAATPATTAAGPAWQALLDAAAAPAWRGWAAPGLPAGWVVRQGVLSKDGPVDDLVSVRNYADFELEFQWRVGLAGNSGVFYRGTREYDHIYWSAPEYQLLDDANAADGKIRLTSAGAAYAVYASPAGFVKPAGQWNSARILVRGSHVEHWLNGHRMVDYELGSADWLARVAGAKFAQWPAYGKAASGMLGIQGDHPGKLALRAMRIRELP